MTNDFSNSNSVNEHQHGFGSTTGTGTAGTTGTGAAVEQDGIVLKSNEQLRFFATYSTKNGIVCDTEQQIFTATNNQQQQQQISTATNQQQTEQQYQQYNQQQNQDQILLNSLPVQRNLVTVQSRSLPVQRNSLPVQSRSLPVHVRHQHQNENEMEINSPIRTSLPVQSSPVQSLPVRINSLPVQSFPVQSSATSPSCPSIEYFQKVEKNSNNELDSYLISFESLNSILDSIDVHYELDGQKQNIKIGQNQQTVKMPINIKHVNRKNIKYIFIKYL
jgi:hypothetical protein